MDFCDAVVWMSIGNRQEIHDDVNAKVTIRTITAAPQCTAEEPSTVVTECKAENPSSSQREVSQWNGTKPGNFTSARVYVYVLKLCLSS